MKLEHFPRYTPFVRGILRSPVNFTQKGQWRGALVFSLICAWIAGWVNNGEAGDFRRHPTHYDVIVMWYDNAIHKRHSISHPCRRAVFYAMLVRIDRVITASHCIDLVNGSIAIQEYVHYVPCLRKHALILTSNVCKSFASLVKLHYD